MPLPYRYLTALMTRFNGSSMLIDCGEGTQVAIKEKGWSFKPIDVICFYTLSRRSYKRSSGTAPYDGKCRPYRAAYIDRTKRT